MSRNFEFSYCETQIVEIVENRHIEPTLELLSPPHSDSAIYMGVHSPVGDTGSYSQLSSVEAQQGNSTLVNSHLF